MVELTDMAATEALNPATANADAMGTLDFLTAMNAEDHKVPQAVGRVLPRFAAAVDLAVAALKGGGRLIYVGAGTSGRLGVLDASECPPTFGTAPETVVGVIAGGDKALTEAVEGAEDSAALAEEQLGALKLGPGDVVVGLAASGRTPFVIGALAYARGVGAATVSVACNPGAAISRYGDVAIEVDNGPEVLTGSPRLKAGTSQKLILNMI